MSHVQQMRFVRSVRQKYPQSFENSKVLEVGSLNINGTIRILFDNCEYLGVDVAEGPGVDLVCQGQDLAHESETYDTVVSCECFEHNPYWAETFANMYRLTKPNGLVIFSCATLGRAEHGTDRSLPQDSPLTMKIGWNYYFNLTEQDFTKRFDFDSLFSEYEFSVNNDVHDLYFYGIKK